MYLDTSEREKMKVLVGGLFTRWFIYRLEEISAAHIFRITVLSLLCMCGAIAVKFSLPSNSAAGSTVVFFMPVLVVLIIWISDRCRRKRIKEEIDPYPPENWDREIEELETTSQERELFLKLLDALQGGSKEEFNAVFDEVRQSPTLCKLSFVREPGARVK